MLKYQVEGEKNMPFTISKLMLISNAEGVEKDEKSNVWNMDIMQNNDVYIEIMKNKNYKQQEIIESITLDNFVFSLIVFVGFAPIFWDGFHWTVLQCAMCALTGAVAELILEIIFSPIGYRIIAKWKKYNIGKEYLDFIAKGRN